MPRNPRLCFEGAFYHITSRGDNKEKIFYNEWDRKAMFSLLKEAKSKFCFRLHAYTLMQNHFHFVIETSEKGTISEIMHHINGKYTKHFNSMHKRSGHLFQGRFHGVLIDKDNYLLEVTRYVHLNPVRAGLVEYPEEYKWSSYRHYIGLARNDFVDKELILDMISPDRSNQVTMYLNFTKEGLKLDFKKFKDGLYKGAFSPKKKLIPNEPKYQEIVCN